MKYRLIPLLLCVALAATAESESDPQALSEDVEALKLEMLDLSRDLERLEEDLLFPANTQVAVFLSLADKTELRPSSVHLTIDGQVIASHVYSDKEVEALQRGGAQRLYTGNLTSGRHAIEARFIATGGDGELVQDKQTMHFTKETGKKYLELVLGAASNGKGNTVTLRELP